MPLRRPVSVEVVDTPEGRVVVTTYADGSSVRKAVDAGGKPSRKPRKPIARARIPLRLS